MLIQEDMSFWWDGSEMTVLATLCYTWTLLLQCLCEFYEGIGKHISQVCATPLPQYNVISLWFPQASLLMVTWFPWAATRMPRDSLVRDFWVTSLISLCWPKSRVYRVCWLNCLIVYISAFFPLSLSQSLSEFVVCGLLYKNCEAAALSIMKSILTMTQPFSYDTAKWWLYFHCYLVVSS